MPTKPPTAKQLAYLRTLADRTGQTFVTPRTSRDASAEIRRLKATPAESRGERSIERDEIADAIAAGPPDSARVIHSEVTGYGSNCRWSHQMRAGLIAASANPGSAGFASRGGDDENGRYERASS